MKRKINRDEVHETILNLIDLGFTAPAVTYMINRTSPVVYNHLQRAGRMKGRSIVRKPPGIITAATTAAMRKMFPNPEAQCLSLLALCLSRDAK